MSIISGINLPLFSPKPGRPNVAQHSTLEVCIESQQISDSDGDQIHSTLEVPGRHSEDDRNKSKRAGSQYDGLQLRRPDLRLFDSHKEATTIIPAISYPQLQSSGADGHIPNKSTYVLHQTSSLKNPRSIRWVVSIVAIILIVVVVGGTVGGIKGRPDHNAHGLNSQETQTESAQPQRTSIVSKTKYIEPSKPSASVMSSSDSILDETQLASIAWKDDGGIKYRRLYYQAVDNTIMEASWNSSTGKWSHVAQVIEKATAKSPIASAVVQSKIGPSASIQINLYFIAVDGTLTQAWIHPDEDVAPSWTVRAMFDSDGYPLHVANYSHLAAVSYADCSVKCSYDPFVMYQDQNNQFRLANSTGKGSKISTLPGSPLSGSGMSLVSGWTNTSDPGLAAYYQEMDGNLSVMLKAQSSNWSSFDQINGQNLKIPFQSPIVSFQNNGSMSEVPGAPLLVGVLYSGPDYVSVTTWNSLSNKWQLDQIPAVLQGLRNYTTLAANDDGCVYALKDGSIQEFMISLDGKNWSLVSSVANSTTTG